jgi:hypothetical protein|tara:strand:- start:310 stop:654 length:345 start_codon:yes stop_codon:yes gene_type:complete
MAAKESSPANLFSDDWVKYNSWMGEANEQEKQVNKKRASDLERFQQKIPCFVNFPDGLPIPAMQNEMEKIHKFMKEQQERLEIFTQMMAEKSIRPGVGSVGTAHKGWGASKRKY